MSILSVIQLVAGLMPTVKGILDAATSNESIAAKIKDASAPLAGVLDEVGAYLFPKVAPETQRNGCRARSMSCSIPARTSSSMGDMGP